MAVSVLIGLLALLMPVPEAVHFEEVVPVRAEPTIEKKGPKAGRAQKDVAQPKPKAPAKPVKPPVLPKKTTVSGRITAPR